MKKTFDNPGDFDAPRSAELWLKEKGYSVGAMQGSAPRGILKGEFLIAKWRNLNAHDRNVLDGQLTGDSRSGPITVEIYEHHLEAGEA